MVLVWLVIFDLYLVHLIFLLNPVFNYCNNLFSSPVDKITTEMYNFASLTLNVAPVGASVAGGIPCALAAVVVISAKTQFIEQVNVKNTSQLTCGIFNVFEKLLRCFNGTENSASSVFPSLAVFAVILSFYLKYSEYVIGSIKMSL